MNINNAKGFTLTELMVIVSIVLVLAAIAIPNYSSSIARSEQAEAKEKLAEIYVKMMSFEPSNALNGFEDATLVGIGFNPPDSPHYSYSLSTTTARFSARAEGIVGRVLGDVWKVNEVQKVPFDDDEDRFDQ